MDPVDGPGPDDARVYRDRAHAGRVLAQRLSAMALADPLVLALPRGGVPVGVEIARALRCPLDVLLVRKLGAPGFPELGLGAVVEGDPPQRVLTPHVVERVRRSAEQAGFDIGDVVVPAGNVFGRSHGGTGSDVSQRRGA